MMNLSLLSGMCNLPPKYIIVIYFGTLVLEYWLGKTPVTTSGSLIELILNVPRAIFAKAPQQLPGRDSMDNLGGKVAKAAMDNFNVPGFANELVDDILNEALDNLVKSTVNPFDDMAKAALYPMLSKEVKDIVAKRWADLQSKVSAPAPAPAP
jgi:hypothetical protein